LGKKQTSEEVVSLSELIDVKGWKAIGNKLVAGKIKEVVLIPSTENDEEDNDEPIDPNDSDPNNDPENGGGGDNSSDEVEESESKYNIELEITNFQQGEQGSLF
jgi:topoisomerase-4 subunit A